MTSELRLVNVTPPAASENPPRDLLLAWADRKLWIPVAEIPWLAEALSTEVKNGGVPPIAASASAVAEEPGDNVEEEVATPKHARTSVSGIYWAFRDEAYICKVRTPEGVVETCRKGLKRRQLPGKDLYGMERAQAQDILYKETVEWRREVCELHGLQVPDEPSATLQ